MFPKDIRILIVDDMLTMRKIVQKILTDLGFTNITAAEDGQKAWEKITGTVNSALPYQLIISDVNMPNLNGMELLKKVKTIDQMKPVPFIFLSAEGEKKIVVEAIQSGATTYILKPFTPQSFSEKLKAAYDAHSTAKAA
ncbi:MAG: response regulator [Deltaproteobacteria bacterium]|nr:response regulator [Deltaproteobacteria bacterium]